MKTLKEIQQPETIKIPTEITIRSKNKTPVMAQCNCGIIYECINGWAVCPKCSKDGTFAFNKWVEEQYTLSRI